MRAIIFLLFIVFVFLIIRFTLQRIRVIRAKQNAEARAKAHEEKVNAETMVACAYCQVHLPKNEAIEDNHAFYCCEEHRILAQKQSN